MVIALTLYQGQPAPTTGNLQTSRLQLPVPLSSTAVIIGNSLGVVPGLALLLVPQHIALCRTGGRVAVIGHEALCWGVVRAAVCLGVLLESPFQMAAPHTGWPLGALWAPALLGAACISHVDLCVASSLSPLVATFPRVSRLMLIHRGTVGSGCCSPARAERAEGQADGARCQAARRARSQAPRGLPPGPGYHWRLCWHRYGWGLPAEPTSVGYGRRSLHLWVCLVGDFEG